MSLSLLLGLFPLHFAFCLETSVPAVLLYLDFYDFLEYLLVEIEKAKFREEL